MKGQRVVESYCGCCGRPCSMSEIFCKDCMIHVATDNRPPWERTFSALNPGERCPFEE